MPIPGPLLHSSPLRLPPLPPPPRQIPRPPPSGPNLPPDKLRKLRRRQLGPARPHPPPPLRPRRYGPAVRVGPNHISLDGSVGWPEVYGRRPAGEAEFQKLPPLFEGQHEALIFAARDRHRRQRRQLGHAFSDAALAQQEPILTKYVNLLIDRLTENEAKGRAVDIVEWLNFTTFDIVGELMFSTSFSCLQGSEYHPWVKSIFRSVQGIALIRFTSFHPWAGAFVNTFIRPRLMQSTHKIRGTAKEMAKDRMNRGPTDPNTGATDGLHQHTDMIAHMLKKTRDGADGFTESEVLQNAPTLVIAGSETTATALSGFCFYASRTPRVYDMVANEIRSAFASEQDITLTSAASLEYLQACISETLRMYPPAAETPARVSPGAMVDGKFVPAGTVVSVSQWATFQNPSNFTDPQTFHPERWLPATHPDHDPRFAADNRAVLKPFSYGPRDCIGKNLAYAEMRLIICRLMYRFDFSLVPGQEDWHDEQDVFLLWQKSPLYLKLHRRITQDVSDEKVGAAEML